MFWLWFIIYIKHTALCLGPFWSFLKRIHHFSEIMKPNPRRANHHEDFYLKLFAGTPWTPITSFNCEETISLLD